MSEERMGKTISLKEIGAIIGRSPRQVRTMIDRGIIRGRRIHGTAKREVFREDFDKYWETNGRTGRTGSGSA
jgi:hypothetical protein